MKFFRILFLASALLSFNLHFAQSTDEEEDLSLDKGSIESQFEFVFEKSGNYRTEGKVYEVVRKINLEQLRQNVKDSLIASNNRFAALNTTIASHESTIASLNKKLDETSGSLSSVTEEKDSMSFLGIRTSKATYNVILWTIIAVLLGLLLMFIYRFRRSNVLTQEAKSNLSELEVEYEDHRRRALEREQRISRQLQDEINKYKKAK